MILLLLALMAAPSELPPLPWVIAANPPALARPVAALATPSAATDTNAPAPPSHTRATPSKHVLLRWLYPPEETNVTFWVYGSTNIGGVASATNLLSWTARTNFPYNVRAIALPTPGAMDFFTVCASNDAGQVCVPRVVQR